MGDTGEDGAACEFLSKKAGANWVEGLPGQDKDLDSVFGFLFVHLF
jgi:hypothetical protein